MDWRGADGQSAPVGEAGHGPAPAPGACGRSWHCPEGQSHRPRAPPGQVSSPTPCPGSSLGWESPAPVPLPQGPQQLPTPPGPRPHSGLRPYLEWAPLHAAAGLGTSVPGAVAARGPWAGLYRGRRRWGSPGGGTERRSEETTVAVASQKEKGSTGPNPVAAAGRYPPQPKGPHCPRAVPAGRDRTPMCWVLCGPRPRQALGSVQTGFQEKLYWEAAGEPPGDGGTLHRWRGAAQGDARQPRAGDDLGTAMPVLPVVGSESATAGRAQVTGQRCLG